MKLFDLDTLLCQPGNCQYKLLVVSVSNSYFSEIFNLSHFVFIEFDFRRFSYLYVFSFL